MQIKSQIVSYTVPGISGKICGVVFVAIVIFLCSCTLKEEEKGSLVCKDIKYKNKNNEIVKMISKSKSSFDVLKNLNLFIGNDTLLRDDVYNDGYLKKIYGYYEIKYIKNEQCNKEIEIKSKFKSNEHIYIYIGKKFLDRDDNISQSGKIHAYIIITSFSYKSSTAEDVINIFGMPNDIEDPYAKSIHSTPLSPGNHKYGNKMLVYYFETFTAKTRVTFLLEGDGRINRCNFMQEER